MNWSIRIVSTLVLASCMLSCKKDSDSKSNSNKTRLSKLVSWRTSTPSKNITTTDFIYDDQKRVVEIAFLQGDSVNGEIKSAKYRSLKFFYSGNDKSPYKTLGGMSNISSSITEYYHSYNTTGSLVRDSTPATPPYTSTSIRRYSYSPDKIIVQNEYKDNYYTQIMKDSFRVANNNLVDMYINVNPYNSQTYGYKLIYDNKVNPISTLNIAAVTVVTGINGFPSFLAPGFCKNNVTEYTYGYSSSVGQFTGQNVYFFTYTYSDNKLPEECLYVNGGGGGNTLTKYYYID
jgi:hypothetical protein